MVDRVTFSARLSLIIKIKLGDKIIDIKTTNKKGVLEYDFQGSGNYDFICQNYPEYSLFNYRIGAERCIGMQDLVGKITA